MKLDQKAMGLALGIVLGVAVFGATIWVFVRGGGYHVALLKQFYIGYSISIGGAFVGLIYGFIDGFIAGWLLAWLYNLFAKNEE